ncbi:LAGLIDADG family homing endonuclease [Streptomyces massasporeus]
MDLTVPEYAYMFGFLQADGHLQRGTGQKGKLTVELKDRDAEVLRKFQSLTPFYSSISTRSRSTNFSDAHTSVTWSLYSLEARTKLSELGLPYGPKSKTIAPPLIEFSSRDYLRGVIDADGSVGFTGKGYPFIALTTASTAMAAYVCRYGQGVTGVERSPRPNGRDGIYNVLYSMEAAQRLAAELYYPNCLSLERKREVAASLTTWVRPAGMRRAYAKRRWADHEDRILLKLNSPTAAAEALGRTAQSCNLRMWRLRTGQVPLPGSE